MKIIYIIILAAGISYSQTNGTITGKIMDADSKEVLIGANVLVFGTNSGAATDENGLYSIKNVPVGTYSVRISYIGYIAKTVSDVVVKTGRPTILNVELKQQALQTNEVVITSGYFSDDQRTMPSVIGLTKEEIRRYPGGFEDVVRTVSTLPGVAINSSGGRNDLLVRGGGPSENLYVINNIEVPNINHFGSQGLSSGSLSFINLDFVENVNFSTGGFGAQYGDKMSSVLSLKMAQGRSDRIGAKGLISATQFGFDIEGPVTNNGNFIFSARKSYLDLIFKAAGLAFIPVYTDYNFIFNYDLDKNDRLFVIGLAAVDNVDRNLSSLEDRIKNESLLDNTQNQYITGINYRRIHKNGYSDYTLNANIYKYKFSQIDRNDIKYFSSNSDEIEYGLKAQRFMYLGKNVNLIFGASGKLKQNKNLTAFADTIYNSSGQRIAISDLAIPQRTDVKIWNKKYAAFIESEINLTGNIFLNLGVRSDYYTSLNKSFYIAPRLTMQYKINEKSSLKFNYGIYYQSPSEVWLVNDFNRNLKALRNDMFIIGYDYLIQKDLRLTVESYLKNYKDLPTGIVPGVTDYLVISNIGGTFGGRQDDFQSFGYFDLVSSATGKAYGAEINIQKKYSDIPFYGQASISYGKSELTAFNGKTYPNQFDQRFIFNLYVGYKINENWEVNGKFRYFTGVPYTPLYKPSENRVNPGLIKNVPAEYLTARLQAAHHLDLRVDRYFYFESWTLTVFIDVQNVYNYKIPQKPQYDFWNDEIINSGQIGVLPSIGVSAEF